MAGVAGPLLQLSGIALQYTSIQKQGKEAKRQAYEAARMRLEESATLGTMTLEKLHDLEKEKHYAKGSARAEMASAGVKVGAGSALTIEKQLEGVYRRKQELLSKETGKQRAGLEREASELRRMGKKAMKSSRMKGYASLLTGGFEFGRSMQWWGV